MSVSSTKANRLTTAAKIGQRSDLLHRELCRGMEVLDVYVRSGTIPNKLEKTVLLFIAGNNPKIYEI